MEVRRKAIGILMIVLSIGALGIWELWGRENFSYKSILVFREAHEPYTVITEDMLQEIRVERASNKALRPVDKNRIIGMETRQYVPAGQELFAEYFRDTVFKTGFKEDSFVLKVPDVWLVTCPESIKRGDKAFFYLGEELLCEARVIHVKDSYGQEITYSGPERYYPTNRMSLIEVIMNAENIRRLSGLAEKGNRFTIIYAEEEYESE
ncbi:MAG: hypothetical protein IJK95_03315 [Firmicutes bacterium]|nr:hypothetical protein [Bacillota bacterium]